MWVDSAELRAILMDEGGPGVFSRTLGFYTRTNVLKGVHVMNDLAQTALGGTPQHRGDLLAAAAREPHRTDKEDAGDAACRQAKGYGERYAAALPEAMTPHERMRLRHGIRAVVAHDGGIYVPGKGMNSGLVTHIGLLGSDKNFVNVGIGRYLFEILSEEGKEEVRRIFRDRSDPHTRALLPLLWDAPLTPLERTLPDLTPSPFDLGLGVGLSSLLGHRLSKPTRLRLFLLGGALGLCLKGLGVGQPDGRPVAFATPGGATRSDQQARRVATQAWQRGMVGLERALSAALSADPRFPAVLYEARPAMVALPFQASSGDAADVLAAARGHDFAESKDVYWPDKALIAFGKRAGCIEPLSDQAGWGKRLALTADHLEALTLMFTQPSERAVPWELLWSRIAEAIGLRVGANPTRDAQALRASGSVDVPMEALAKNAEALLQVAVRRGVARRLPDSGAEAGGGIQ